MAPMALLSFASLLLAMTAAGALSQPTKPGAKDREASFQHWAEKYHKQYSSDEEYRNRLSVFISNSEYIERVNREQTSYELGLNEFADMTFEEFASIYLQEPQDCSATHKPRPDKLSELPGDLPTAIDWRDQGVVTPVKNQGKCGSCWTFSTTGCLESHHAIKTGDLISLSEQQLVDCAGDFNNHGCQGGLPSQAFEYIHYNGGLESEKDYPYRAENGKCHFNQSEVAATVAAVMNISQGAEDDIYTAVGTVGPVSVAYEVVKDFRFYKKGVYSSLLCSKSPQKVNHAVLAVGYNVTALGEPYWIVKNSWGTSFGIKGYFWMKRGSNECGLADCASYPVV